VAAKNKHKSRRITPQPPSHRRRQPHHLRASPPCRLPLLLKPAESWRKEFPTNQSPATKGLRPKHLRRASHRARRSVLRQVPQELLRQAVKLPVVEHALAQGLALPRVDQQHLQPVVEHPVVEQQHDPVSVLHLEVDCCLHPTRTPLVEHRWARVPCPGLGLPQEHPPASIQPLREPPRANRPPPSQPPHLPSNSPSAIER